MNYTAVGMLPHMDPHGLSIAFKTSLAVLTVFQPNLSVSCFVIGSLSDKYYILWRLYKYLDFVYILDDTDETLHNL